MKDLKNYRDYKLYLKDVYKTKSEKHTRFSFAVWANSLGISSPSLLSNNSLNIPIRNDIYNGNFGFPK